MPLLNRKPFTPEKPPKDLKPNEEVFVCTHTNEVFREYEAFFKRTILCNSLVWSCRFTGKSGLTYEEAEESEEDIIAIGESLSAPLRQAVLTLVHHTHRGKLANLCDEVFFYLKDRFQEGEEVELQHNDTKRTGVIQRVIEPGEMVNGTADPFDSPKQSKTENESSSGTPSKSCKESTPSKKRKDSQESRKSPGKGRSSSESDKKHKGSTGDKTPNKTPKSPRALKSSTNDDVIIIEDDDDDGKGSKKSKGVGTAGSPKKKAAYNWPSAQDYKYAVKLNPETVSKKKDVKKAKDEIVIVSGSCLSRKRGSFTRDKLKNFLRISCMRSTISSDDGYYIVEEKYRNKYDLGDPPVFSDSPSKNKESKSKKRKKSATGGEGKEAPAKKKQKHNDGDAPKKSKKKLTHEEKLKLAEEEKEKKKQQIQEDKEKKKLQKEKDRAVEREKREKERVQKKLEKDKERERQREQKRKEALWYREWSRPREDLQLDDLKDLPNPIPVRVKFPSHLFGDVVMVLEFLNVFGSQFDIKDDFPSGLTFAMLEEALTEHDAEGVYYDLLQFLLGAILRTHMDEEEDEGLQTAADAKSALQIEDEDERKAVVSQSAVMAAAWPLLHQGKPLHELIMDPYTCTELLRLHLLSSGARIGCDDYRWHGRGGFTYADDVGVEFRHSEPEIIRSLKTSTVYDLGTEDKLKILKALCGQLVTYATARDYVEEGFDRVRKARREWLSDQWKDQRREKEEAAAKWKRKVEERARHKEEQERLKKEKEASKEPTGQTKNPDENSKKSDSKKKKSNESERATTGKEVKETTKDDDNKENESLADESMLTQEEEEARAQERKLERERRDKDYLEEISKGTAMSNVQPLGRDRMYRRYWAFRCLKGLFIEDDEPELPQYLETIVEEEEDFEDDEESESDEYDEDNKQDGEQQQTKNTSTDNKETAAESRKLNRDINKLMKDDIPTITLTETEREEMLKNVKKVSEREVTKWAFISSPEDLESLVSNLNPRGHRERGLREALQSDLKKLATSVNKCPFRDVNIVHKKENKPVRSRRTRGQQGVDKSRYTSMEDFAEANLRDQILDLEDRIWQGGLGVIGVEDRMVWRKEIEKGIYDDWEMEELAMLTASKKEAEKRDELVKQESEDSQKCDAETINSGKLKDEKCEFNSEIGIEKDDSLNKISPEENTGQKQDMEIDTGMEEISENGNDLISVTKVEKVNGFKEDCNGPEKIDTNQSDDTTPVDTKPLTNGDIVDDTDPELARMDHSKPTNFAAIPSHLKLELTSIQVPAVPVESRTGTPLSSVTPTPSAVNSAVMELALALLKVEKGVDPKYLCPPLGEDEETKRQRQKEAAANALQEYEAMMKAAADEKSKEKKKRKKEDEATRSDDGTHEKTEDSMQEDEEKLLFAINAMAKDLDSSNTASDTTKEKGKNKEKDKTVLERWEESLTACTSLSQVFVHLNTLDGSIAWSKSVLNARCKLCRRKGDAEKMLLCDACDRGHHMYCLKPPIKHIPEGNWFCPDCRPKEPRRGERRRKVPAQEASDSSEVESESEEESNSDTEEYEHSESEEESAGESDHGDTCAVCSEGGELLCCDICPLAYHVHCAYPPLRRVPRGNWACQVCTGADEDRSSKARVKKSTIKEALKKAKGKQKPVSATKKTKPKQDSSKKKRKRSPSPPTSASREGTRQAKRPRLTDSAKSSRSASPATKPVKRVAKGIGSADSSRSPSPVRKATARRDPRLAGRLLKCEKLLTELMEHEDADPFVGSTGRGKQSDRLNLATIQKKLTSSQYGSIDEFLEDVRKVFIDCAERSRPRSKETKAGARLSAFFETKFSDMGLDTSDVRTVRSSRRT
ncbi:bromodomain adjacent to zinc finger domain protein 1A isoform X2 [Nematostella vectensis]|uniref:bromodomain adjacent to zinc finger domain protein 1A isoform X2 n=1 Tax=Nematostella vectensis TaxID=45351 RepID=UPI0020772B47|nr:bromodomain adjacent to zinc finger domain protein 1A isoform X2 [Nematostella vectensis]